MINNFTLKELIGIFKEINKEIDKEVKVVTYKTSFGIIIYKDYGTV